MVAEPVGVIYPLRPGCSLCGDVFDLDLQPQPVYRRQHRVSRRRHDGRLRSRRERRDINLVWRA